MELQVFQSAGRMANRSSKNCFRPFEQDECQAAGDKTDYAKSPLREIPR
jgi:hypothetical protein